MAEVKEKKVADYSKSAENLVNPSEVKELLNQLHQKEKDKEEFEVELKEQCADLVLSIADTGQAITELQKQIKEAVEQFGSYQDLEAGDYAVKYRRVSKSYDAEEFAQFFDKFAPAVIIQTVNEKALEGLIKGGLITEQELKNTGVLKEDTKYAYVIR